MSTLITTFISPVASAFSAATQGYSVPPKAASSGIPQTGPTGPLVASKSRRLDSELRPASPLWAAQVSHYSDPREKASPLPGQVR